MLLTAEQLAEIRQIIEDHHNAFVANTISPDALQKEVLDRLKEKGLIDVKVDSLTEAYVYGHVLAQMESAKAASMTYPQFKAYVTKNPVALTTAEKNAVALAQSQAGQYCKGLGNRVSTVTGDVLIEADQALRARMEATIRDTTAETLIRRETVQQLKSKIGWETGDWSRDLDRIAATELQNASELGVAQELSDEYGDDVLVSKVPADDACFRAGAMVETRRGAIPIEEVTVGDEVLTHRLRYRKVTHLFRREFSGVLYGFNGREASATGNHPMLADLDWRRADSIEHGSYLTRITIDKTKHDPSLALKKHLLFDISGSGSPSSVPISSVKLYGYLQMRNSDVDVEFVHSEFGDGREVCERLHDLQTFFGSRREGLLAGLSLGPLRLWGARLFSASTSAFRDAASFFIGQPLHASPATFCLGRDGNAPFSESLFYRCPADAEVPRDFLHAIFVDVPDSDQFAAGNVFLSHHAERVTPSTERVNSIARESYDGDVHNLEVEEDNSYVADGLIVHNCQKCKELFLSGGQPKVFKLSTLQANGTNVGRKQADWLPVAGTIHPSCGCAMVRVPKGWGWEDGELIPGVKSEIHSEEALTKALTEEDEHEHFPAAGRTVFQGMPITIETKAGQDRHWTDAEGNTGTTRMLYDYGYVENTNGCDEDPVDVFVGPNRDAEYVYVCHQQNPANGLYSEEKCFLGFGSEEQAAQAYLAHYTDHEFLVAVSVMGVSQFKRWVAATFPIPDEIVSGEELRLVVPIDKVAARVLQAIKDGTIDEGIEKSYLDEPVLMLKAIVPKEFGGTSPDAANRAPGQGNVPNILFNIPHHPVQGPVKQLVIVLKDPQLKLNRKHAREAMTRDPRIWIFDEPAKRRIIGFNPGDHVEKYLKFRAGPAYDPAEQKKRLVVRGRKNVGFRNKPVSGIRSES